MNYTMDITLIVKASNQQFEDQTIKCEPSWTIKRLKGHLTEVHPGKPSTDEQKLIYSGQLLSDNVILKDILRHYDGQQAHTLHLVFTPKNNRLQKDFSSTGSSGSSGNSNTTSNMPPKAKQDEASSSVAGSNAARSLDGGANNSSFTSDGLRQRNVIGSENNSSLGATVTPSPISPASADFIMSQQLAMQNWMQQAYMQYLNQYMNVISNGQNNPQALYASAPTNPAMTQPSPTSTQTTASSVVPTTNSILAQSIPNLAYYPYLSTMNTSAMPSASTIPAPITSSGAIPSSPAPPVVPPGPSSQPAIPSPPPVTGPSTESTASSSSSVQPARAASPVEGAAPAQAAPVAGPGGAAQAAAAAPARRFPNIVVEEQENRDWLDIFFSMCRVGILLTVVYLYSSPARCFTVFCIGISLYLYQIGFFRNNNADRLERARRIVVQQINNAHGARQNAIPRPAAGPVAPAEAPANIQQAANPAPVSPQSAPSSNSTTDQLPVENKPEEKENAANSTLENAGANTDSSAKDSSSSSSATPAVDSAYPEEAVNEQDEPSNATPETNRVNLNDVAAFLRTLVLSFFTSIIPDTPAA